MLISYYFSDGKKSFKLGMNVSQYFYKNISKSYTNYDQRSSNWNKKKHFSMKYSEKRGVILKGKESQKHILSILIKFMV